MINSVNSVGLSRHRSRVAFVAAGMLFICAPALAASSAVTFASPMGGEVFIIGGSYTIKLAARGAVKSVKLELSRDGGQTFSAIGTIDNTESDKSKHNTFTWVPVAPASGNCVVRATGSDKNASTVTSSTFAIGASSVGGGNVDPATIPPSSITTVTMADGSVNAVKLADGSVTTPKLADGAVTTPKIATNAVSHEKISSGAASNKMVLTADGLGNANWSDSNALSVTAAGPAGGDLTGNYPNPTFATGAGNDLIAAINNAATTTKLSANVLPLVGAPYVLKSGDVMGGFLTLNANPTVNLHAATKQYVDAGDAANNAATVAETARATAAEATKVAKAGDTMTGALNLPVDGLVAGTSQLVLNGGKVGIGNASPSSPLTVNGQIEITTLGNGLKFADGTVQTTAGAVAAGSANYIQNQTAADQAAGFRISGNGIFNGGNVGIGTTTPSANLEIKGASVQATPALQVKNSGGVVTFAVESPPGTTGLNNTFVGQAAGAATTTGGNNTFVGQYAGNRNTTGGPNTFVGQASGALNTTGSNNTFVGFSAGGGNTTASANSFLGVGAGNSNTSGSQNVFVGLNAGANNTTASSNSFFGTLSGQSNTTGSGNTFAGQNAGINNTSGGTNIAIGINAGMNLTTGDNNIDIFDPGVAGESNTIRIGTQGTQTSTFIGGIIGTTTASGGVVYVNSSGQLGTLTGSTNIFLGDSAGVANTTATKNTFVGQTAGSSNTTGSSNSFFGQSSGQKNTVGVADTFIGVGAGASNTTASNNTFVGASAGNANTTGQFNTFTGLQAGALNTTGGDNAFFGVNAGEANTTGQGNTAIGTNSGNGITTGQNNVIVGNVAGLTATTESNITLLGAGSNISAGITNATAIGANASVTQSNSLVLGNAVKVGIGTTAPSSPLTVNGQIEITTIGNGLKFPDGSTQSTAAANFAVNFPDGVVGTSMLIPIDQTGYTVPVGKTLYILTAYPESNQLLSVGGKIYYSFGSVGTVVSFSSPLVIPGGSTITAQSGSTVNVTAIQCATTVTSKLISISNAGYTVPLGKTLYIMTAYPESNQLLSVGGKVYYSFGSVGSVVSFASPLVIPGGSTISAQSGSTVNVTAIER